MRKVILVVLCLSTAGCGWFSSKNKDNASSTTVTSEVSGVDAKTAASLKPRAAAQMMQMGSFPWEGSGFILLWTSPGSYRLKSRDVDCSGKAKITLASNGITGSIIPEPGCKQAWHLDFLSNGTGAVTVDKMKFTMLPSFGPGFVPIIPRLPPS